MLSKTELKYLHSLCQKKQRAAERLFIAEGVKMVDELLKSHYKVTHIYATDAWLAPATAVPITIISEQELEKISSQQAPNQVLAIVAQPDQEAMPVFTDQLTLAIDGIQDPGNLGTIIRIADWFGIRQIVASEDTVEWYNPKVIQATMGGFIRVKGWNGDLSEWLKKPAVPVFGALLKGRSVYEQPTLSEGILVIGNESKGIRETILPYINHPVTIPRIGGAESLNAGVATGIIVSHLLKTL